MTTLPPDPDSVERWKGLPQTKPSRQALPPAAGGLGLSRILLVGLFLVTAIIMIVSLLAQSSAA
jgi:hypothetical protein